MSEPAVNWEIRESLGSWPSSRDEALDYAAWVASSNGQDGEQNVEDAKSGGRKSKPTSALEIVDVAEVFRRVDAAAPPTWLIQALWPADAYGVTAAEDKAGKTWAIADLIVSVATGTPWLGHFECEPGRVLAFFGEGGERNITRRLRAILASRGLADDALDGMLRICSRVPHLTDREHLERVRVEAKEHPPVLTTLDPFYLAGRGAKQSDLFDMGGVLEDVQIVMQEAGSALAVSHHWNQTGSGSGWQRLSGAGPSAWGRVLGSAAVVSRATEPDGTSDVLLRWEFVGSEITDTAFTMRRRVRAEDPDDLRSPLTYEVEVSEAEAHSEAPKTAADWIREALGNEPENGLTVKEIGDRVAEERKAEGLRGLKADTIRRTLNRELRDEVDSAKTQGDATRWWLT